MDVQQIINLVILGIIILVPHQPQLVGYTEAHPGDLYAQYNPAIAVRYQYGGEFEKRYVSTRQTGITMVYPQLRYEPFIHERTAHSAMVSRFGLYPQPYRQVII